MGIPVKKSRRVEHAGKHYRYLVRETGPSAPEDSDPSKNYGPNHRTHILVTVQEDVGQPGRVLQAKFLYGTSVSVPFVAKLIEEGLHYGWDPSERGAAFSLDHLRIED